MSEIGILMVSFTNMTFYDSHEILTHNIRVKDITSGKEESCLAETKPDKVKLWVVGTSFPSLNKEQKEEVELRCRQLFNKFVEGFFHDPESITFMV